MKRLITILTLVAVILVGGVSLEAKKTTKKKASTTSSIKFSTFSDGYPSVAGHTYSGTMMGVKFTVKFGPYNGSEGVVTLRATRGSEWEEEVNNWYYKGNGIIMFYMNGGSPCYYQIEKGGREIYNDVMNLTLKAIK